MKKLAIFFLILNYSCNHIDCDKKEKRNLQKVIMVEKNSRISDKVRINRLLDSAIFQGDTTSYDLVSNIHLFEFSRVEFLYYALIMANKYDYDAAYLDVYLILSSPGNSMDLGSSGAHTKEIAYYYLLKAREKGNANAEYFASSVFGKRIPKSSDFLH